MLMSSVWCVSSGAVSSKYPTFGQCTTAPAGSLPLAADALPDLFQTPYAPTMSRLHMFCHLLVHQTAVRSTCVTYQLSPELLYRGLLPRLEARTVMTLCTRTLVAYAIKRRFFQLGLSVAALQSDQSVCLPLHPSLIRASVNHGTQQCFNHPKSTPGTSGVTCALDR
jgi:hypothetical protein